MSDTVSPHRLIQSQHVILRVHGTSAIDRVRVRGPVGDRLGHVHLADGDPTAGAATACAGQRIISAAQDARTETDHDTLVTLHRLSVQQIRILEGQNEVLDLLRKVLKA